MAECRAAWPGRTGSRHLRPCPWRTRMRRRRHRGAECRVRAQHDHRKRRAGTSQFAHELERRRVVGIGRGEQAVARAARQRGDECRAVVHEDNGIHAARERRFDPAALIRAGIDDVDWFSAWVFMRFPPRFSVGPADTRRRFRGTAAPIGPASRGPRHARQCARSRPR
jgi:hypothetical protein